MTHAAARRAAIQITVLYESYRNMDASPHPDTIAAIITEEYAELVRAVRHHLNYQHRAERCKAGPQNGTTCSACALRDAIAKTEGT